MKYRLNNKNRFLILSHVFLIILCLCMLMPFILMVIASFTEESAAIKYGYSFFPKEWSVDAYRYIFMKWSLFGKAYLITFGVTAIGVTAGLLIAAMMAYAVSRKDLPGGSILMFYIIFTMLFNGGLVATYINYTQVFHIKNTYAALIVPNLLTNAFGIVMLKNYFQFNLPMELNEAARIDGASEYKIFFTMVLPLSKPILATVGLIVGLAYWNDWQNGMYYLDDMKMYGIQNVLNNMNNNATYLMQFAGGSGADIPTTTVRMAIALVGILPILIVYPFFQEYFVRGITAGAVKG